MSVDYTAWLKDPTAIRVVLVEVNVKTGGLETTRFLSTKAYVTTPADSPANQYYEPIITTGIQFTEQVSLTGKGSLSVGDIEIANYNGDYDIWLNDIWDNRNIKAYVGDVRWARTDFQMIFNGVVATVGSKSRDVLNISIMDKLQKLNQPITDTKIGGTSSNKGNVISLSFGEVSNISPQLTNSATLEYQVHDSNIEGVFEVRDNGKPVSVSNNSGIGRFTLTRASVGSITCSAQGDKNPIYLNTISSLVQRIVVGYGNSLSQFTTSDLDTTVLSAFDTACPQPVGIYTDGRTNVLDVCNQLADSVGAQLVMSRLGLLRLIQVQIGSTSTVSIDGTQMLERTLKIKSRPLVQSSVMLGFDQNYTVQTNMLTSIPDAAKMLFANQWLSTTATSTSVQSDYRLNAAPIQVNSCLCVGTDATAEAQRRLNLWSVPRTVFEFEGTSDLLQSLQIGTTVTLTNRRFGLSAGKIGTVISLSPNWLTARVIVNVLI